jgi:hypothetical protein
MVDDCRIQQIVTDCCMNDSLSSETSPEKTPVQHRAFPSCERNRLLALCVATLIWLMHANCGLSANASLTSDSDGALTREKVIEQTLHPFSGVSHSGVDVTTLHGKVMAGYQGWFGAPIDGAELGWKHWTGHDGFQPGSCSIDLWPDVSELDPDERYPTAFQNADGTPAEVFSSYNRKTVLRHFQWMKDYGIDGVFVQRFITQTFTPRTLRHVNVVLNSCRDGANLNGRAYAVMYDLSGLGRGQMNRVIEDWKLLVDRMQITKDPAYVHHAGKPVIAVWGFGFDDHREYTLDEGLELVNFLKNDPHYGNCTVMLGVPAHWRTLDHDSVADKKLHELILKADIVSPWTVGRYRNPTQAIDYAEKKMRPDLTWCREHEKEFMPVVFPGFSWHNLKPKSPLNEIPRLKGDFLWTQFVQAKKQGASMVYVAMFDEVDEGTAIFKCTNYPPNGLSRFVTFEGLPSDFYLRMTGRAAQMIRGEAPLVEDYRPLFSP